MKTMRFILYIIIMCISTGCIYSQTQTDRNAQTTATIVTTPTGKLTPAKMVTPTAIQDRGELQKKIANLVISNKNCSGFCFWGIYPGLTKFADAVSFLNTVMYAHPSLIEEGVEKYSNSMDFQDGDMYLSISLSANGGLTQNLQVTLGGLGNRRVTSEQWLVFRPDQVMESNGLPERVLISMAEGPEGRIEYSFIVLYKEGYYLYDGNQSTHSPDYVLKACPNNSNNIQSFRMVSMGKSPNNQIPAGYIDINELISISTSDFHNKMIEQGIDACFNLDYQKFKTLS